MSPEQEFEGGLITSLAILFALCCVLMKEPHVGFAILLTNAGLRAAGQFYRYSLSREDKEP